MKKLILILSIFLVSCGYAPIYTKTPNIITSIDKYDDLYCNYYINQFNTKVIDVY